MSSKILPLESLRGLAALSVALYHFNAGSSILSENVFIRHSELMVDFFFVLSGFVIALTYWDKIEKLPDLIRFQTKRFWRLYPLHLVTLFGFIGIETLKYLMEMKTGVQADTPAFSENNLSAFLHNVFMTHALFMDHVTFNYPSWSISAEFYTYLVFGIVMLSGRFRIALCALVMGIGFGVLFTFDPEYQEVGLRFFRSLYAFFLGALGFWGIRKLKITGQSDTIPAALLILSVLAMCFVSGTSAHIFVPLLFLALVLSLYVSDGNGFTTKILSHKVLVYFGTISYSIYMVHAGMWWFINQVLRFVLKVPTIVDEGGRTRLDIEPLYSTGIVVIGLALIISVSHLTYILIEDKFRMKPKKVA